jgi:uncharacterized protein (TIGR02145 family)
MCLIRMNMIKQYIFTLLAVSIFTHVGIAQSQGIFIDSRDSQTYKTISYKNTSTGNTITWMAQNLNFKVEGSHPYDGDESNRQKLGLLYTWEAAKKACPRGWHLATDGEWSMLVNQFGGTAKAGEALKSLQGWNEDGNGTNSSGFNAPAGGLRRPDNSYMTQGILGIFWTSSPAHPVDKVWAWNFHYGGPPSSQQNLNKAFRFEAEVSTGLSVRLVRD